MCYISSFSVLPHLSKPLQMPDGLPCPQQERKAFSFQIESRILQAFLLQKWNIASHAMISIPGEQSRSSHPKFSTLGVRAFGEPC